VKYALETLGCAKNQVESELMTSALGACGFLYTENAGEADVIIVNSCGFIESAKRQSINAVLELRKEHPDKKIILAGCLAARYAKELRESLSEADGVFESLNASEIGPWLCDILGIEKNDFPSERLPPGERRLLSPAGSAYVRISDGCSNRCSFCAIPLIRGGLRSRPIEDVSAECRALIGRGVKELCLIAQDSASFGLDLYGERRLADLLRAILEIEGDFWVRILYLHPDHFPYSLIPVMRQDARAVPYFDLPFQHASQKMLRAMNRKGGAKEYLDLINILRNELDAVIRSTFLLGFPGESEADFEELLDFQLKARLDWMGSFTYSREEGSPSFALKNRPGKKTALERKQRVDEAQSPITHNRLARLTGSVQQVIVEEETDAENGLYIGRPRCAAPEVDGCAVIYSPKPLKNGTFAKGLTTAAAGFDLQIRVS
jgi:ribosomal protein S12 methylthiotransferase